MDFNKLKEIDNTYKKIKDKPLDQLSQEEIKIASKYQEITRILAQ